MPHSFRVIRDCRSRRIRLKPGNLAKLIRTVKACHGFTWPEFSKELGVSINALSTAWGREFTTISEPHFWRLVCMLPKCRQVEFTSSIVEHMNPNWGQLKGIEVSLRSQGLKRMKKIRPSIINSPDFAEFVGILLGDGHIERKTVVITLNNRCENEYAEYVCSLVEKLFGKKPSKFVRGNGSCICVFVHSTELAAFLAKQGIPLGARKLQTIHIPCVFMENEVLTRCFVRGLVDTDGGVFRKSRHDMRLLIEFKNLNKSLLNLFLMGTKRLGFHPSSSGGNALRIQTQAEVHRYAREVGFSNHKNLIRYSQWTQQ